MDSRWTLGGPGVALGWTLGGLGWIWSRLRVALGRTWGGLGKDLGWPWGGFGVDFGWPWGGLGKDLGFPLVVANEISSNAFLGTPIPTRPRDAFIRVVGGTNPRGCRCPRVSPNKGVEGVGLRFGHTTRTQERAQRLQVWKGRKRNLRISEGAQNL